MKQIIDSRGTGKTKQLMEFAQENSAIFVCGNPIAMRAKAQAYNVNDLNIVSYYDFIHDFDPAATNYVVDELEMFIKAVFSSGPELIGYTLSIE